MKCLRFSILSFADLTIDFFVNLNIWQLKKYSKYINGNLPIVFSFANLKVFLSL